MWGNARHWSPLDTNAVSLIDFTTHSREIMLFLSEKRLIYAEGSEASRLTVHHGWNNVHQTIQSREVTVLSVALHPHRPVCQLFSVRERSRFTKIDHPDFGPSRAVVDKQQRAANHLSRKSWREKQERMRINETLHLLVFLLNPWAHFPLLRCTILRPNAPN